MKWVVLTLVVALLMIEVLLVVNVLLMAVDMANGCLGTRSAE